MRELADTWYSRGEGMEAAGVRVVEMRSGLSGGQGGVDVGESLLPDWKV